MVWGRWSGHEPQQCVERFAPALREAGFEVDIADTLDAYLDAGRMAALSLMVPCRTMDAISHEQLDYSSLGHVASDFDVPEAFESTRRGMLWAAR